MGSVKSSTTHIGMIGMIIMKSQDAEEFWYGIGPLGRSWYLNAVDEPELYVDYMWNEMPDSARTKLGRKMNDRKGRTYGRHSAGYVRPDLQIGLSLFSNIINQIILGITPEQTASFKSINQMKEYILNEASNYIEPRLWNTRIVRKVIDKILGVNIKKGDKFTALVAGIALGVGGSIAYGKLKDELNKYGLSPESVDAGVATALGSTIIMGGAKYVLGKKKANVQIMGNDNTSMLVLKSGEMIWTVKGRRGRVVEVQGIIKSLIQFLDKDEVEWVWHKGIMKESELLEDGNDGMTTWDRMSDIERMGILKTISLPETLAYKRWGTLHETTQNMIKGWNSKEKEVKDTDIIEIKEGGDKKDGKKEE